MSSHGGKLDMIVVNALIISLVIVYQIIIICNALDHPSNNSIFGVLFILLLSTAISITEVILVSKIASFVISITWLLVLTFIFAENVQVIACEDIVFTHGIQKLIGVIYILLLGYAARTIVHSFNS